MEKVRDVVDAISSTLGPTLFSSSEKNVMANEEDTASSTSPIYLLPSKTETEHNLKPSKKKGLKGFKKKNKNKKQNKIDKFMVTVSYLSKLEGEVKEAKEVLNEVAKFQNQVTEYDKLLEQELKKIFQFILPTEAVERSPAHNSEIAEASVVCQAQSRSSTQYQTAMEIALLKESSRSLSYHGGFSDINVVHTSSSLAKSSHEKVRDYRADWSLSVNQPVAGNYYPLNLGIFTLDKQSELSVLVDRATGGASIEDGELELMLHRRMIYDDSRGVGEALDESICIEEDNCEGLTIRGNYYLSINKLGTGARWRRTTGQNVYSPLLLTFTHEKMENWRTSFVTDATIMEPSYSLPPNVALITLQDLDDGTVLLRLAHLYEAGEDAEYSSMAKVELKKMFAKRMIKGLKETSLSTNQLKSEMKKMKWKVEGESREQPAPLRGRPVDSSTLVVELGPMEIRTFLLNF